MLPVDAELLLNLSTKTASLKRGHVFFGYMNDEAMVSHQNIQYITQPIIFKATLDETRDTIIAFT